MLVRNTPSDPHERATAIGVASLLADQAETLLLHWDTQLHQRVSKIHFKQFLVYAQQLLIEQTNHIDRFAHELEQLWSELENQASKEAWGQNITDFTTLAQRRSAQLLQELSPGNEACQEKLAHLTQLVESIPLPEGE
ncbi:MAG: hypothetical protein RRB13_05585 [bacterium]|nr:hypothetical protein [bacterium]